MRRATVLVLAATLSACGEPIENPEALAESVADVNAAASAFVSDAHSFDYAALRASATSDFEILIFGRRLSLDGFIELLREMEESRGGRHLSDYELEALNTEIVGDVAYTTWASPNWLESAIFVRRDGRWLMDRAASVRIENGS